MRERRDNLSNSGILGFCGLVLLGACGCTDEGSPPIDGAEAPDAEAGAEATGGVGATGGVEATGGVDNTAGAQATGGDQATGGNQPSGGAQASAGTEPSAGTEASGASMAAAGADDGGAVSAGGTEEAGAQSGGTGGETGGEPAVGSCDDDFSCPDLGTCSLRRGGDGCIRICALADVYAMTTEEDVARLAELRCEIVDGSLDISGNQVGSLTGLGTISEVTGDFTIRNNDQSPIALPPLRVVDQDLTLLGLSALESIDLPLLESVGDALSITGNSSLVSIEMDSLRSGTILAIGLNDELVTLNGLPALQSVDIFIIGYNPKLPQCEVDMLVDRVDAICSACTGNDTTATCD